MKEFSEEPVLVETHFPSLLKALVKKTEKNSFRILWKKYFEEETGYFLVHVRGRFVYLRPRGEREDRLMTLRIPLLEREMLRLHEKKTNRKEQIKILLLREQDSGLSHKHL